VGTRVTKKASVVVVSDIMPALARVSVSIGRTWFIKTCVPAFNPEATQSSSVFSNRFFSRTTAFKKSVLSMCGAWGVQRIWVDDEEWSAYKHGATDDSATTHYFFIEKHLHHTLDRITNMYEFKKL
jgi:hypothetical protein